MRYFSGFALRDEYFLFDDWLIKSQFSVSGFSKGSIEAFEYTLNSNERIDRLLLFSPAFFQNLPDSFKKKQLESFKKNRDAYIKYFMKNISYPSKMDLTPYYKEPTIKELEELLNYKWDIKKFEALKKRGVTIEVFLGQRDKIIDVEGAISFFTPLADATYIFKEKGHILYA